MLRINETQKALFRAYLKFPILDILETFGEEHPILAFKMLNLSLGREDGNKLLTIILNKKLTQDNLDAAEKTSIQSNLNALSQNNLSDTECFALYRDNILPYLQVFYDICQHPCPQNRSTGSIELDDLDEDQLPNVDYEIVIYRNDNNEFIAERKGLLSLTAKNDNTAQPITKNALLNYMKEHIWYKITAFAIKQIFKRSNDDPIRQDLIQVIPVNYLMMYCDHKAKTKLDFCVQILNVPELYEKIKLFLFTAGGDIEIFKSYPNIFLAIYKKGIENFYPFSTEALNLICLMTHKNNPEVCVDILSNEFLRNKVTNFLQIIESESNSAMESVLKRKKF